MRKVIEWVIALVKLVVIVHVFLAKKVWERLNKKQVKEDLFAVISIVLFSVGVYLAL